MTGINELPASTLIGLAMLALAVPYMLIQSRGTISAVVRAIWQKVPDLPDITPDATDDLTPAEVLSMVERAKCPQARDHLLQALNCLLEPADRPEAAP